MLVLPRNDDLANTIPCDCAQGDNCLSCRVLALSLYLLEHALGMGDATLIARLLPDLQALGGDARGSSAIARLPGDFGQAAQAKGNTPAIADLVYAVAIEVTLEPSDLSPVSKGMLREEIADYILAVGSLGGIYTAP